MDILTQKWGKSDHLQKNDQFGQKWPKFCQKKKIKKVSNFFCHVREESLKVSFLVFYASGMGTKDTSDAQKKIYEKVPKLTPEGGLEFRLSIFTKDNQAGRNFVRISSLIIMSAQKSKYS